MFSKRTISQDIVDDFDAANRRLQQSGKLEEIKQRYLNPQSIEQ
jgi:ABC-type amino acid transport substrate-binding protein